MPIHARYVHTNIIARDWQALAHFYIEVFGCAVVPPERDLHGEQLERGTGVPQARLRGVHLRLPGWGEDGPTLEIYSYNTFESEGRKAVNRPGFGHLAFRVEDMDQARAMVFSNGGKAIGEVATTAVGENHTITWCYMTDPEGNPIELQTSLR